MSDAFRNVRVGSIKTQSFCYTVGYLVVIDFRLTFERSRSPGLWGVTSAAVEHVHCNTTLNSTQLLDEGKEVIAHVNVVDLREEGKPEQIPPDAKRRVHSGEDVRSLLHDRVRRRPPTNQATTLRRQDCPDRVGLTRYALCTVG